MVDEQLRGSRGSEQRLRPSESELSASAPQPSDLRALALIHESWVRYVERVSGVYTANKRHQCWLNGGPSIVRHHAILALYGCTECGRLHRCQTRWDSCFRKRTESGEYVCAFSGHSLGVEMSAANPGTYDEEMRLRDLPYNLTDWDEDFFRGTTAPVEQRGVRDLVLYTSRRGKKSKKVVNGPVDEYDNTDGDPMEVTSPTTTVSASLISNIAGLHETEDPMDVCTQEPVALDEEHLMERIHDLPEEVDTYRSTLWRIRFDCIGPALRRFDEQHYEELAQDKYALDPLPSTSSEASSGKPVPSLRLFGRSARNEVKRLRAAILNDVERITLQLAVDEDFEMRQLRVSYYSKFTTALFDIMLRYVKGSTLMGLGVATMFGLLPELFTLDDHTGNSVLLWRADPWLLEHRRKGNMQNFINGARQRSRSAVAARHVPPASLLVKSGGADSTGPGAPIVTPKAGGKGRGSGQGRDKGNKRCLYDRSSITRWTATARSVLSQCHLSPHVIRDMLFR